MESRVLSTAFLSPPKLSKPTSPSSSSSSPFSLSLKVSVGNGRLKCKALGESSQGSFDPTVYQGLYGPWTVDSTDVKEVILYRSGLVTAAASFVVAASAVFLPSDSFLTETIKQNIDLFYILGAGGLGLSLILIHIYVTELKRTLQAFWALGVVGSLATYAALALPAGESLVQYVINNPTSVWFVGVRTEESLPSLPRPEQLSSIINKEAGDPMCKGLQPCTGLATCEAYSIHSKRRERLHRLDRKEVSLGS